MYLVLKNTILRLNCRLSTSCIGHRLQYDLCLYIESMCRCLTRKFSQITGATHLTCEFSFLKAKLSQICFQAATMKQSIRGSAKDFMKFVIFLFFFFLAKFYFRMKTASTVAARTILILNFSQHGKEAGEVYCSLWYCEINLLNNFVEIWPQCILHVCKADRLNSLQFTACSCMSR